ncbi:MAG TPA: hypothetical protein VHD85_22785 [Terracidiphilus sp.]|nr:hypothetical protein [Terracidiphilus sp.]
MRKQRAQPLRKAGGPLAHEKERNNPPHVQVPGNAAMSRAPGARKTVGTQSDPPRRES